MSDSSSKNDSKSLTGEEDFQDAMLNLDLMDTSNSRHFHEEHDYTLTSEDAKKLHEYSKSSSSDNSYIDEGINKSQ